MSDYIEVFGLIGGTRQDNSPMQMDDAANVGHLLARDATFGTFGVFSSDFWKGKLVDGIEELAQVDQIQEMSSPGEFSFRLRVQSSLFDPLRGGIQHLIGILAGDLGILQVRGLQLRTVKIRSISFPSSWEKSIREAYRRDSAHDITEVRTAFKLEDDEPLLAFSIKPRIGLTSAGLEEITLGVLAAGFHIVELDTRDLDLSSDTLRKLVELSKKAAQVGKDKRVTRFSVNVSVPSCAAIEICGLLKNDIPAPFVVKVDGGLDGISTCQAVRRAYPRNKHGDSPYITTYPLLRRVIQERIADDTFLKALIWSGSDIIYPGNAPNLGGYRQLDHAGVGSLATSVDRYWQFLSSGFPMPTVAGGIYPGQLQAYYELLGPKVAYFIGGGLALHKDGPLKGAQLCARIIKEARHLRSKAKKGEFAIELSDKLKEEAEGAIQIPPGADEATFRYFPPSELLKAPGLQPWFKR